LNRFDLKNTCLKDMKIENGRLLEPS
jgi:hypothetical protein